MDGGFSLKGLDPGLIISTLAASQLLGKPNWSPHLHQSLRCEDVLDFTGADAKGKSSESTVRGSVGVATHNN